jgi:small subunit ribosomal protein S3e
MNTLRVSRCLALAPARSFIARSFASQAYPRGLQGLLEKRPDDVVITYVKRTAIGRAKKGQFKKTPIDEILAGLLKVQIIAFSFYIRSLTKAQATFETIKLDPSQVDDIAVGEYYIKIYGQTQVSIEIRPIGTCHPPSPLYISRAAALAAGIPDHVPIHVINRLCSSGLMAIRSIAHAIKVGDANLGIAIGMESMSL